MPLFQSLAYVIRKCKEMGLRKIRCEADSKQLLTYINNKAPVPELYGIVSDILALAAEFQSISFVWISRSRLQNVVADELVKQSYVLNEELIPSPNV